MLIDYINAAMHKAHYEILPDDEGYFGKIEGLEGVLAYQVQRINSLSKAT